MANILIVEDSQLMAKSLKNFLESQGHQVVAIGSNGDEGVELYKNHQPDLVTLDITMPVKDGRQCLREIMAEDANARVLMISAVSEQSIVMDCLKIGARGYIEKPIKFSDPGCQDAIGKEIQKALEN